MAAKKLKTICPHCNRAIQIDLEENADQGSWLLCTPLPAEDSDTRTGSDEGNQV